MKRAMLPLNISLLTLTPEQLKTLRPVTVLDIFDGPGGNFHQDGLFSTQTFGRMGDPLRSSRFGYIALKLPVLHPLMYTRLIRLKGLYRGILAGTEYALWDPKAKDFEKSSELEGRTGYQFFMEHFPELTPKRTGSDTRDLRIEILNKYRDQATLTNLLVLPAGLRDVRVTDSGRVEMDVINELYQAILMQTRNLPERITASDDLAIYDRPRHLLTLKILEIYQAIERLISGKNGFIQEHWASRRVFNGSLNVISSLDTSAQDLTLPNRPGFNDSVMGLYQLSKAVLPKTIYALKTSLVGEVFSTTANTVELVHPKTLKRVWVEIPNEELDTWGTDEGLERVINQLAVVEQRDRPVLIADHYLALVYVDDADNFKVFRDIEELPKEFDRAFVRPITYIELIYLAGLGMWNTNRGFVTRYPVENVNSSAPTKLYVKTTVEGELRYELNDEWERAPDARVALEYPVLRPGVESKYHDALSVNPSRLRAYGGD